MQRTVNFIGQQYPEKLKDFGEEWDSAGEGENKYFLKTE